NVSIRINEVESDMATHKIHFLPADQSVDVPTGALITDAMQEAQLEIQQPCGGQGRCGRCAVIVEGEGARRRSTIRISAEDIAAGYALACQTIIEGDLTVTIPEQEKIERRLVTDKSARKVELPFEYDPAVQQTVRAFQLEMSPPSIDDNLDDLSRLRKALRQLGVEHLRTPVAVLRRMGTALRQASWSPWVVLAFDAPGGDSAELLDIQADPIQPYGLALDIGTTTVTAFLVDLASGEVKNQASEYNGQIARGEDVISRIVFAAKGDGLQKLYDLVRETIDTLLDRLQKRTGVSPQQIYKVSVAGNTTMMHLFLGIPPESIRLTPYVPAANQPSTFRARELELNVYPLAPVDCLPAVASYVGADITAGVLASKLSEAPDLTLFIDVGTNGETVLGTNEWMVTCACSAGPAFEGAGVIDGMRATLGAIEEVWVNTNTYEPTIRVIGGKKPVGICGSGLISLLAELFVTGVVDRAGNFKLDLDTPRVRQGQYGPEYIVAWGEETEHGRDIALNKVDVDNLMRAKAAIYAGFSVLADSVGVELEDVQQMLVGGAFGQYINVENAIKIGLLPDLPWDRFNFLGNTSVLGSYMALLSYDARQQIRAIAEKMTYVELSADNTFYDAFTAALFLPHTEINRFPSVAEIWERYSAKKGTPGN
ncbi:MAG: ASKHA domain-containing protein, partial [Anaerolineales bacterium]